MSRILKLQNAYKCGQLDPARVFSEILFRSNEDSMNSTFSTNSLIAFNDYESSFKHNNKNHPLYGIPFTVKDNFTTDANMFKFPTTCASKMLHNFYPQYNASVVESLLTNGALLLGKTNLDEFAMGCGTVDSTLFGPAVNPWSKSSDDLRVSGGSSGGSASAVAAGYGLFSIGSDTGGSIRLPAALCGVVGFKPSFGSLSRHGLISLCNLFDTPSIISQNVQDALIVYKSLNESKVSRANDSTLMKTNENGDQGENIAVGVPKEFYVPGLSKEIAQKWDSVLGDISDSLKIPVKQVSLPHMPMSVSVYVVLCCSDVASNMTRYDGIEFGYRFNENDVSHLIDDDLDIETSDGLYAINRRHGFNNIVRERIICGNYFLLRENKDKHLANARKHWSLIIDDFRKVFEEVSFLVTPVHLDTAMRITDFKAFDNRNRSSRDDVCTVPANLAGLPAVSVPVGLDKNGLPIGLQIIGQSGADEKLLQFATKIETLVDFKPLVNIFDWFE